MAENVVRYYEDVDLGDEIGPLHKDISEEAVATFCRVRGSPRPNRFLDEDEAKRVGLSGRIVPGIMSMAMMAQLLTDWSPTVSLKHLDVVFRQPVFHKPVVITAVVTDMRVDGGEHLVECDVILSTEDRGQMIGGKAILALPSRGR
jgi:acyl dehydratase